MEGSGAPKRPLDLSTGADRPEHTSGGGGGAPPPPPSLFSPTAAASPSFKRRHFPSPLSAASASKHQLPHMKLSGGETVLRVVCPADKTGGVIGKGGAVVRQLREETGARIRVEDSVPGSDDRVILIVAEKRKEAGGGGWGDGDGEEAASPAQRALVRVFERILRVEEEKTAEGEGAGAGEEKEIQGLVMCRLLAPSSQVGCVLGKGGKIVEKIRQESGAQIRVLSAEQVPACAAPGDELIHITGSFSAVRKALLAVSGCLQDNLKTDISNFMASKSLGGSPLGAGPAAHMERFPQRGYPTGLHPSDYHPRYSSHLGLEIHASSQRKVLEEDVLFRMLCTNDKVGSIIGKGGSIVRALQSDTGASIKIVDAILDSEERVIAISARENSEFQHSPAQDAVLRVHSRLAEAGIEKGAAASARLLVPSQQIGCLLGKGGNIIAEMRRATGANIRIFLKEHVPKCAQPNDEVVQITGSFQSVQDALLHITGRIRETIFPLKSPSIGTNQYISAAHDVSALSRSRNELTSPSGYSSSGMSHGLDRYGGPTQNPDWQPPLSHNLDPMGPPAADRVPYSRGSELFSFDHSSSPRPWAQMNSGNHRDITDAGTGLMLRSGDIGGGGQVAVATSTTVEVVVPHQFLGYIYGENSSNLSQIREISGAKVDIHDPKPGATVGTVVICGTPDQAHIAKSVLHAFVLSGKATA
ncbi:hypothetical protein Taro_018437 [Colocasia esculenta]|uniref:K Homology domain-containing protein n=1 Tax=Colocasia esculenta TaxID=4460 RepID=A0A843URE1_COLES|nr:hypothetical protein [Colocasia esculenta]